MQNVVTGRQELGVRLRSDVDGQITALRYWKGASETGRTWGMSGTPAGSCWRR